MDRKEMKIKLEPGLAEGKNLYRVYYLPDREIKWYFLSEDPMTRNIDEFMILTAEEGIDKFPETEALLMHEPDRQVMFQKGQNSGKWIDFV